MGAEDPVETPEIARIEKELVNAQEPEVEPATKLPQEPKQIGVEELAVIDELHEKLGWPKGECTVSEEVGDGVYRGFDVYSSAQSLAVVRMGEARFISSKTTDQLQFRLSSGSKAGAVAKTFRVYGLGDGQWDCAAEGVLTHVRITLGEDIPACDGKVGQLLIGPNWVKMPACSGQADTSYRTEVTFDFDEPAERLKRVDRLRISYANPTKNQGRRPDFLPIRLDCTESGTPSELHFDCLALPSEATQEPPPREPVVLGRHTADRAESECGDDVVCLIEVFEGTIERDLEGVRAPDLPEALETATTAAIHTWYNLSSGFVARPSYTYDRLQHYRDVLRESGHEPPEAWAEYEDALVAEWEAHKELHTRFGQEEYFAMFFRYPGEE